MYGDLLQRIGHYPSIIEKYPTNYFTVNYSEVSVYKETVGQFTGLCDKNLADLYEDDIVKTKEYGVEYGKCNSAGYDTFRVIFEDGAFRIENKTRCFYLTKGSHIEVIGNIHDNPNLLK